MEHSLLFFNAITPVHNGAGEGLGIIDRPIIRERISSFPYIQSSSIKGVIRDEYAKLSNGLVDALFGPENGEKHSGAVSFGDANIFCFPVRSLQGCFVWATSPLILYRLHRVLDMGGLLEVFPALKALVNSPKLCNEMKNVLINKGSENILTIENKSSSTNKIILEEFPKAVDPADEVGAFASEIAELIFCSDKDAFFKDEFIKKFVVLPENSFRYFVTNATEVVPNIKIDSKTGTSKEGLRYTEYLPSETILYSLVGFEKARIPSDKASELSIDTPERVKELFCKPEYLPEIIQIGADETKGKGLVKLVLI